MRTFVASLVFAVAPALAQDLPKMKPGAWEITNESEGGGMSPEMLAKMPPQAVEAMKRAMSQAQAPQKFCVTANDQDYIKSLQSRMPMDVKCNNSTVRRTGSTYSWTSNCTGSSPTGKGAIKMEGEHTIVYDGGDRFQQTSRVRTEGLPMGGGTNVTKSSGRFLGADCKAHGAATMEERIREMESMMKARPR